jgi:hypothetical protein
LFSSVALPMPEEGFETAHEEREHRIAATLRLEALMRSAFGAFLQVRTGESWGTLRGKMRSWITEQARPSAQTSMVEGKPAGEVAAV